MKRLMVYIKPFMGGMAAAIFIKALGAVTDILIPFFMGKVIDDGIARNDIPTITKLCIVMLVLTVLTAVFNIVANYVSSVTTQSIGEKLRDTLYHHIQGMTVRDVDDVTTASLITRATNDVEHVQRTFLMMTRFMIRAPIMAVGGVVMSLAIDPGLTAVIFVSMILLALASTSVYKVTRPIYRRVQVNIDRLTSIIRENLGGIRVIKAFSKTEHEVDRVKEQSKIVKSYELKAGKINAFMGPSITLITNVTIAVILFISGYRIQDGNIEIGQVVTVLNYINMILMAMTMIPRMFMLFSRANTSAARIADIMDNENKTEYGNLNSADKSKTVLSFEDVSFTYPQSRAQSLSHITFTADKGETVAVIGSTGSGKSTLLNLILRLYEPTHGSIKLYGQPISAYTKEFFKGSVTAAMQQYNIFGMSIRENIVLDMDDDDDRLGLSADSAQLSELIDELDDGFEHRISQTGTNLSGGQKQRISVARTLYRDPDVVVLDDVSAALDYRTDYKMRTALRKNYKDKTVVLISQRISSVKNADRILVLEKGRMVGLGTHSELIKNCETYRDICRTQNVPLEEGGEHFGSKK